ncbi:hypothetical protein Hdeb2414_s0011g00363781 [Helianthus debilis subsp. tardiflorus]
MIDMILDNLDEVNRCSAPTDSPSDVDGVDYRTPKLRLYTFSLDQSLGFSFSQSSDSPSRFIGILLFFSNIFRIVAWPSQIQDFRIVQPGSNRDLQELKPDTLSSDPKSKPGYPAHS